MNQILDYSPNKNSGGNSSRTDKIVRVFAVFLILFAVYAIINIFCFRLEYRQSEFVSTKTFLAYWHYDSMINLACIL